MGNDSHDKCLPYMNHDLLGFFQQIVNFCALRWQLVWRKNVLLNFSKCIFLATWITHWMPYVNDFETRRSYFAVQICDKLAHLLFHVYHHLANCNYWCLRKTTMAAHFHPTKFAESAWMLNVLKRGEKGGRGGCFIGSQRLLPLVFMQGASCKKMASLKRSKGRCCCVHFLWFIHQW